MSPEAANNCGETVAQSRPRESAVVLPASNASKISNKTTASIYKQQRQQGFVVCPFLTMHSMQHSTRIDEVSFIQDHSNCEISYQLEQVTNN